MLNECLSLIDSNVSTSETNSIKDMNKLKEFIQNEIAQYGDKAIGKDTVQSSVRIEVYEKILTKIKDIENAK